MRRPVSRATTLTRWILAGLGFVGLGFIDFRYGHRAALITMLLLLLLVFFRGGSAASPPPE